MKKLLFISILLLCSWASAQTRININNNAFIRISNGAKVVVDNSNTNAVQTSGTGGNIVSEGETNQLIWKTGTNTGAFIVPFTTLPSVDGGNQTKIPLSTNVTSAGVGAGEIQFSTYETATDMNTAYPSDVTNMDGNGIDNSLNAVDRFWIIDAQNYTTKPAVDITFTYDDAANEIAGTNTLLEANLQAQRWNSTANDWEYLLFGTVNTVNNTVSGVSVAPVDFFRSWTLVNNITPLPIKLLEFEVEKENRKAKLNWETASENNSLHFVVERTLDGEIWDSITTVEAQGYSEELNFYETYDETPQQGFNYYRLKQVDTDGWFEYSEIKSVLFNNEDLENLIQVYPNPFDSYVYVSGVENQDAKLYDVQGRLIRVVAIRNGLIENLDDLINGVYLLEVEKDNTKPRLRLLKQ